MTIVESADKSTIYRAQRGAETAPRRTCPACEQTIKGRDRVYQAAGSELSMHLRCMQQAYAARLKGMPFGNAPAELLPGLH